MREEEVVTRAAYLLFYQRRSAANDSSRSRDWLSQLQLSTNSSLSRTVTSHSLENLVDGDKGRWLMRCRKIDEKPRKSGNDKKFGKCMEIYNVLITVSSEMGLLW